MAYPTICLACRKGQCIECEIRQVQARLGPLEEGGWFCVCGHGAPENDAQKEVRRQVWAYGSGPGTLAGNDDI